MTSFNKFPDRNRDMQDGTERHVFGEIEYLGSGAKIKVRGNGTVDEEAIVVNLGIGQSFGKDTNTEVLLLASGSDTNLKFALITIPRDKQRAWQEGSGGIQHPSDPERALEFNDKRTHLTDGKYAVGEDGMLEIVDGKMYIRGDLYVEKNLLVGGSIVGPLPSPGPVIIPPFEK